MSVSETQNTVICTNLPVDFYSLAMYNFIRKSINLNFLIMKLVYYTTKKYFCQERIFLYGRTDPTNHS